MEVMSLQLDVSLLFSVENFDVLWGGKWDHHESENHILKAILTFIEVELSIFPTCSGV